MAANFIGPVIDNVLRVLEDGTPELLAAEGLEQFRKFGRVFTGISTAWPGIWVMPLETTFSPEGTARQQQHLLRIKFGVIGGDPDKVGLAAEAYMRIVDWAITAGQWDDFVFRVFVSKHSYGGLYDRGNGVLARYPELELTVDTQELDG